MREHGRGRSERGEQRWNRRGGNTEPVACEEAHATSAPPQHRGGTVTASPPYKCTTIWTAHAEPNRAKDQGKAGVADSIGPVWTVHGATVTHYRY